jgi:hypothetical protein
VRTTIRGLQEAQEANAQVIAAVKPRGELGEAVRYATTEAQRWAIYYTPWDTGSLRASHQMKVKRTRGEVYIDPSAVNPRSGQRPSKYGFYLHKQGKRPGVRGGVRAFYRQTVDAKGQRILDGAGRIILGGLP